MSSSSLSSLVIVALPSEIRAYFSDVRAQRSISDDREAEAGLSVNNNKIKARARARLPRYPPPEPSPFLVPRTNERTSRYPSSLVSSSPLLLSFHRCPRDFCTMCGRAGRHCFKIINASHNRPSPRVDGQKTRERVARWLSLMPM